MQILKNLRERREARRAHINNLMGLSDDNFIFDQEILERRSMARIERLERKPVVHKITPRKVSRKKHLKVTVA